MTLPRAGRGGPPGQEKLAVRPLRRGCARAQQRGRGHPAHDRVVSIQTPSAICRPPCWCAAALSAVVCGQSGGGRARFKPGRRTEHGHSGTRATDALTWLDSPGRHRELVVSPMWSRSTLLLISLRRTRDRRTLTGSASSCLRRACSRPDGDALRLSSRRRRSAYGSHRSARQGSWCRPLSP